MKPSEKHSSHGMTLIEVMIAMVVFSIGILGLLGMQGITTVNNDRARGDAAARSLALSRLNHLERLAASAPDLTPCPSAWGSGPNVWCHVDFAAVPGAAPVNTDNPGGVPTAAARLNEQGTVAADGTARYRRYWHVQPASTGFPNSVEVRLRVEWNEMKVAGATGRTRNLTYETMLVF